MWVVFKPAFGSVTAKHALISPRISGGSMRIFCASVPNTMTGRSPKMFMWMAEAPLIPAPDAAIVRSEEHTSELQSRFDLVCRLLLEKKKREMTLLLNTYHIDAEMYRYQ